MFRDRKDAGLQLATALARYKGQDCAVLALPRGGVPVAAEIASALAAPLDLILVRKIGAPDFPELAVGAVVDGGAPIVVRLPEVMRLSGTSEAAFAAICKREQAEIERRRRRYLGTRASIEVRDKIAIMVDDGVATGATMNAALQATRRRHPRKLILAVPVASRDAIEDLTPLVDEVVCLEMPDPFHAVGAHYRNFDQTSDEEVMAILSHFPPATSNAALFDPAQSARGPRA